MIKSQNKINISGWGGYPVQKAKVLYPEKVEQIITEIKKGDLIARGNGRAYGDSSINEKKTINMKYLNHIISFDDISGILVVESGILLDDIKPPFVFHLLELLLCFQSCIKSVNPKLIALFFE